MADYIERQAAINILCSKCAVSTPDSCSTIQRGDNWCEEVYYLLNLPAADVVQVARCHYCQYYDADINYCHTHDSYDMEQDDFCSYGERKE